MRCWGRGAAARASLHALSCSGRGERVRQGRFAGYGQTATAPWPSRRWNWPPWRGAFGPCGEAAPSGVCGRPSPPARQGAAARPSAPSRSRRGPGPAGQRRHAPAGEPGPAPRAGGHRLPGPAAPPPRARLCVEQDRARGMWAATATRPSTRCWPTPCCRPSTRAACCAACRTGCSAWAWPSSSACARWAARAVTSCWCTTTAWWPTCAMWAWGVASAAGAGRGLLRAAGQHRAAGRARNPPAPAGPGRAGRGVCRGEPAAQVQFLVETHSSTCSAACRR